MTAYYVNLIPVVVDGFSKVLRERQLFTFLLDTQCVLIYNGRLPLFNILYLICAGAHDARKQRKILDLFSTFRRQMLI